jgi:hypothetical protein
MAVSENTWKGQQIPKLERPQKIEFFLAAPPCSRPLAAPPSAPRRSTIAVAVIVEIMGRMVMMSTALALPIPVGVLVAATAVMPTTRGRPQGSG